MTSEYSQPPPPDVEKCHTFAIIGDDEPLLGEISRIVQEVCSERQFSNTSAPRVARFRNIPALLRNLALRGEYPDLVLIGEAWPGEFPAGQVDELYEQLPLARLIAVLGPWSESVGRTGAVWPPALRVRVRELEYRLRREMQVLHAAADGSVLGFHSTADHVARSDQETIGDRGSHILRDAIVGPSNAPLPLTATRDETFLFDVTALAPSANQLEFQAFVLSSDRAFEGWLRDGLSVLGGQLLPEIGGSTDDSGKIISESSTTCVVASPDENMSNPGRRIGFVDGDWSTADEFETRWQTAIAYRPAGIVVLTSGWEISPGRLPATPFPIEVISKFAPLEGIRVLLARMWDSSRAIAALPLDSDA